MKAKIVKIGNSRGIRLPKAIIDQVGLEEAVDLEVRDGEIVISPAERIRSGWAKAAQALANQQEENLLNPFAATHFDIQEWKW